MAPPLGGTLTANECISPEVAAVMPFGRAPYKLASKTLLMLEQG
jgi:hypothetical protein